MSYQTQVPEVAEVLLQPSFSRQVAEPHFNAGWYEHMISAWGMIPCCFCCPNPFKTVEQGKVGLKCQFGKCFAVVDPGLHAINVACQNLDVVDIRLQVTDIPRQSVFTRDNIVVNIDSVLYWHVVDPYAVVYLVQNINTSLIEKTQTTLREIIGQKTVQEMLEHRDEIAEHIERLMKGPAESFGVKIESILIKDMQFSSDLLESFSSAIKQKRIGEAKIIGAQAEVEAAKMMAEAAGYLATESAMQIRYLETLTAVSRNGGEKLLFVPVNHDQLDFDMTTNVKYGKK